MRDRPDLPRAVRVCPECSAAEGPGVEVQVYLRRPEAEAAKEYAEHERSPQHLRALAERLRRLTFAAGRASGIEAAAREVDDAAEEREATADGRRRNGECEGDVEEALAEARRLRELAATIRALLVAP